MHSHGTMTKVGPAIRCTSIGLLIWAAIGCTSTLQVTANPENLSGHMSVPELQEQLKDRLVVLERFNGEVDSARDVVLGEDGWTTYQSLSLEHVQVRTSSLRRLSFRHHGRGLTEGILLGTLAGGLGGLVLFPVFDPPPYHDVQALGAVVAGFVGGAVGLVGGGVSGGLTGKLYVVNMGPPEQWSDSPRAARPLQEESAGPRLPTWVRQLLRSHRLMITGGFGLKGQLSGQDLIGIGYMNGPWQCVVRYYTGRTLPPSYSYPGLTFDEHELGEWQFLPGIAYEGEYHRLSASLGLTYSTLRTMHLEIPGTPSYRTEYLFGVPFEVRALVKLTSFIGIGISAFHRYNTRHPVSGMLLVGEMTNLR